MQCTFAGSPPIVPGCGFIGSIGDECQDADAEVNAEDERRESSSKDGHGNYPEKAGRREQ